MPRHRSDRVIPRDDDVRLRRFMHFDPMPLNPAWIKAMCAANQTECEFFVCEEIAEAAYTTNQVFVLLCGKHHELVLNPPHPKVYDIPLREHMYGLMQRKSWVYMNAVSDGQLEEIVRIKKLAEAQRGIADRAKRKEIKKRISEEVKASGIKAGTPDVSLYEQRKVKANQYGSTPALKPFESLQVLAAKPKNSGGVPSAVITKRLDEQIEMPAQRTEEETSKPEASAPVDNSSDDLFGDFGLFD